MLRLSRFKILADAQQFVYTQQAILLRSIEKVAAERLRYMKNFSKFILLLLIAL